ncbi:MAG TPA: sigma-70 family RNA polymerase sigma factor [Pyrinomonadaceae bacterium]
MDHPPTHEVTRLLLAWSDGDQSALEQLVPLVYDELHRLAAHYMSGERAGHMLQTTALVNEAYMRLVDWKDVRWQNRAHFFGVAAQVMRRVLVDFARARQSAKRGGELRRVSLAEGAVVSEKEGADFIALDEALESLAAMDPRKSRVVELRFFGGLSVEETAEVLKVSPRTVMREWSFAQAWLHRELSTG